MDKHQVFCRIMASNPSDYRFRGNMAFWFLATVSLVKPAWSRLHEPLSYILSEVVNYVFFNKPMEDQDDIIKFAARICQRYTDQTAHDTLVVQSRDLVYNTLCVWLDPDGVMDWGDLLSATQELLYWYYMICEEDPLGAVMSFDDRDVSTAIYDAEATAAIKYAQRLLEGLA